ncbi:GNAT family N-acetyltransferase [Alteromonadaceae bacterium M269]|nr:GNAT family N-acetyltransferase [Alteromonadaceae bacterium M269]
MQQIQYLPLTPEHFSAVIELGNQVHGDNYLDQAKCRDYYRRSIANEINASWVAFDGELLVGFRITFAAENWKADEWCSPELWQLSKDKICYFKCNTVNPNYQGRGIGSRLLKLSSEDAAKQGSQAGLAHIWLASPGNSAFKYFSKCGGKVIKEHPNKWRQLAIEDGYNCPVCDVLCSCVAAEMLLRF